MIDKFKPFYTMNKETIVFDRLQNKIPHRPVIIFATNSYEPEYYYLKIRSAISLKDKTNLKNPKLGEILIRKNTKGLLNKDSYVDTTQIYKINEKELETKVDKNDILYLTTDTFSKEDIWKILQSLFINLNSKPPFITLSKVYNKGNEFLSEVLYSNEQLIKEELKTILKTNINSNDEIKLVDEILNHRNINNLKELRELEAITREELMLFDNEHSMQ